MTIPVYSRLVTIRDHASAVLKMCDALPDGHKENQTAAAAMKCFLEIYPDSPLKDLETHDTTN